MGSPPSPPRPFPAAFHHARQFFAPGADTTCLGPRWLVLRAVGAVFILVFAGIVADASTLIGPRGLVPLAGFFSEWTATYPNRLEAILRAPSLFWLSSSPALIATLAWTGLVAALALVFNVWPRLALFVCWICLLSFVTTWRGFTASQVDQLMLETAILGLAFAPAGFRPGLGHASPPRRIALFAMRWFLFRVMLESGLVKLFAGDPHWLQFTALDVLYETSPFPTVLGFYDHHLPHAWHMGEVALTYLAELVAPLLAVFAGRRGRWTAFVIWTGFQAAIQFTNNFGWLNTASLALGLLVLDDHMLAAAAAKLNLPRLASLLSTPAARLPLSPIGTWRLHGLRVALGAHFVLTLYAFAVVFRPSLEKPAPSVAHSPTSLFENFHSANAYILFGRMLPARIAVEFEGSNDDGRTWRPYEFRYQPQRLDEMSPFLAPRYARFEATLQVEANRSEPSPLFGLVAAQLLAQNPDVLAQFRRDPFPDRPPTMLRMPVYHLKFVDLPTHRATGHYWQKDLAGFQRPMMYLDARGAIAEAKSTLDELRVLATRGHPPSQYLLGVAHARGEGVPRSTTEAAKWYRLAADQNVAAAQGRLGSLYASGDGVPRDLRAAAHWLRRAAVQGNAYAQSNLALLYARGDGVARDEIEAWLWFQLAAESGDADAAKNQEIAARRIGPEGAALAEQRRRALRAEIAAQRTNP